MQEQEDEAWVRALRGARAESLRLATLDTLDILDTAPDPAFDAVVAEAAATFAAPIALVSLVDADRQWFKAAVGLAATGTPRSVAFCDRAIRSAEVLVVPDATRDERFADNPLVTGDPGIRFYAGAPIEVAGGQRVGTVCIIDRAPRADFGPAERAALADLATRVASLIAARRDTTGG